MKECPFHYKLTDIEAWQGYIDTWFGPKGTLPLDLSFAMLSGLPWFWDISHSKSCFSAKENNSVTLLSPLQSHKVHNGRAEVDIVVEKTRKTDSFMHANINIK